MSKLLFIFLVSFLKITVVDLLAAGSSQNFSLTNPANGALNVTGTVNAIISTATAGSEIAKISNTNLNMSLRTNDTPSSVWVSLNSNIPSGKTLFLSVAVPNNVGAVSGFTAVPLSTTPQKCLDINYNLNTTNFPIQLDFGTTALSGEMNNTSYTLRFDLRK
jgi:hypothetical protein